MKTQRPRSSQRMMWSHSFLRDLCALCVSTVFIHGTMAGESPAAVQLQPGQKLPPLVQLSPKDPVVPWDAQRMCTFHLIDQNGQPASRETLLWKPWVANFIFARCSFQCPFTCKKIKEFSEELKHVDVRFVTITVDPEHV